MRRLLALLLLLPASAFAGAWALDAGLTAGIGMSRVNALPGGVLGKPNALFSLFGPSVQTSGGTGLAGQGGFELALNHKRRFMVSLQCAWMGGSMTVEQSIGAPFDLQTKTVWEWSGVQLPLEISYGLPLSSGKGWALMGRAGLGAWYQKNQGWSKHLSAGATQNLAQAWDGPPDDWGPLAGLGLDWLALPTGKRVVSFEVRASLGRALLDPTSGLDQAVWTVGGVLSVPIKMWVL